MPGPSLDAGGLLAMVRSNDLEQAVGRRSVEPEGSGDSPRKIVRPVPPPPRIFPTFIPTTA